MSNGNRPYTDAEFEKKFWERVDRVSDASGCWLWTGAKSCGYGSVGWNGKTFNAHTVAYILTGHTIPKGYELSHSENCVGKRHCCKPGHLTPKNKRDNSLDRHRDGTMSSAKLNSEKVLDIRKRLLNGETPQSLAEEFGVTKENISAIKLRKTWSHL
jgi:hypothetical protein